MIIININRTLRILIRAALAVAGLMVVVWMIWEGYKVDREAADYIYQTTGERVEWASVS